MGFPEWGKVAENASAIAGLDASSLRDRLFAFADDVTGLREIMFHCGVDDFLIERLDLCIKEVIKNLMACKTAGIKRQL